MFDAARCQELAIESKALAKSSDISAERAILLKNVARTLTGLVNQLDRLASLTRDEARHARAADDRPGAEPEDGQRL
ncbi:MULTISPECIES: hypothetical protein [unclassified Bradyrhizobium]|uniref:hypothetical protein n=1 Tax=unclassified Bradyrhizobium TaxID=2631580 RepID=UPI001FF78DC2|nr:MULTISPECIES: hypothetical protein [unclassified Bradyrhizobium]MCK1710273.1 hypothetical protein [Bradyrhizobium sp. 143]MCK1726621.1 hypothetical protein [Bradyrhizobium sp. 142]